MLKTDMNFLKYFIIYVILQFGINIVLTIFSYLILEVDFHIYMDVQVILLFLCLVPIFITALNAKKGDISDYTLKLIKNLLIPLYIILTLVISI